LADFCIVIAAPHIVDILTLQPLQPIPTRDFKFSPTLFNFFTTVEPSISPVIVGSDCYKSNVLLSLSVSKSKASAL